jgi:pimeloyl-ACP methyl ester carboxylesterase
MASGALIMQQLQAQPRELMIYGAEIKATQHSYNLVTIQTSRGNIPCRHYEVPNASAGILLLTGAHGGWSSPAKGLFPRLSRIMVSRKFQSLQVCYRYPNVLDECILDALAGMAYLQQMGVSRAACIGYSFGGAVAIQTAAASPVVQTVITLATQSYGTSPIRYLPADCSTLLIHGTEDRVVPLSCSQYVHDQAHEPKQIMFCEGADHSLDFVAATLYRVISEWLQKHLAIKNT